MSRVNFEMDKRQKTQLQHYLKDNGYKTISEFFRAKAREVTEHA